MTNSLAGFNKKVKELRGKINDLFEEKEWLKSSYIPKEEVLKNINLLIERQSDEFEAQLNISDAQLPGSNIYQSDIFKLYGRLTGESSGGVLIGHTDLNLAPMMCFFFGSELKKKLKSFVDKTDVESGPPMKDRPGLISAIDSQLLKLEKLEEKIILEAEDEGFEITRRDDCDCGVVLEVTDS